MHEVRNNVRAAYARFLEAHTTLIPQDAEENEEEDHSIPGDVLTETRNKGGSLIGSTIKNCQIQELAQRQAVNFLPLNTLSVWNKERREASKDWSLV